MLALLTVLAVTSTGAQLGSEDLEEEIVEEEIVEEEIVEDGAEDSEEEYIEEEYVEEDDEYDPELEARDERWYAERAFHFALYGGVGFGTADDDTLMVVSVAFGFSQRLAQRWALQGRAAIGSGFSNTNNEGLFGGGPPLFDSNVDLTARVGSRRFYFGFGPFGRFWRVFQDGRSFAGGGGALAELGLLFGEDRQLDLGARLNVGGFVDDDRDLRVMVTLAVSVGWIF